MYLYVGVTLISQVVVFSVCKCKINNVVRTDAELEGHY